MKISVNEENDILLEEVFNPIVIRTEVGDFGVTQRDGGIEIVRNNELVFACYTKSCVTSCKLVCTNCHRERTQ